MERGNIVLYKTDHKSHSWQNGLYIVLDRNMRKNELSICKIDEEGKPDKFDDGRFMRSVTSCNNPDITDTDLKFNLPKDFKMG